MVPRKDQVDNQHRHDDRLGPRLVAPALVRKVRVHLHEKNAEQENVKDEGGKHEAGELALPPSDIRYLRGPIRGEKVGCLLASKNNGKEVWVTIHQIRDDIPACPAQ